MLPLAFTILVLPQKTTHLPVPERPFKMVSEKDMVCLANNIYYEALEESYEGKLAVATVTMNRVQNKEFPKTVCGVVYQRGRRGCQFSWTCGSRAKMNTVLYNDAKKIARQVLTYDVRLSSIKNALYFHNTAVQPNWAFARPIKKIGNHIFYVVTTHENKTGNRKSAT